MSTNGGFPPIKNIKTNDSKKDIKKERFFATQSKQLDIRNILSSSIVKPMIDLNKNEVMIIDSL